MGTLESFVFNDGFTRCDRLLTFLIFLSFSIIKFSVIQPRDSDTANLIIGNKKGFKCTIKFEKNLQCCVYFGV